ncbi:hypothetical protein [Aliiroseovarius sp.]|uniref:hypothetical protein n=1 Tax=Aliiroseovarius sp. TaxID=1872442 RepID=UPI003BA84654
MSVLVASSMKTSRVSDHTSELEKAQSAFGELHTVHNFSLELAFVNFLEKMKALGPELETKLGKNPFPDDDTALARKRIRVFDLTSPRGPRCAI